MVRNESAIIARAIRAAKPYVDSWSIVDTGSTDNTKAIILEELKDLPGTLFERPWKNWSPARWPSNLPTHL